MQQRKMEKQKPEYKTIKGQETEGVESDARFSMVGQDQGLETRSIFVNAQGTKKKASTAPSHCRHDGARSEHLNGLPTSSMLPYPASRSL